MKEDKSIFDEGVKGYCKPEADKDKYYEVMQLQKYIKQLEDTLKSVNSRRDDADTLVQRWMASYEEIAAELHETRELLKASSADYQRVSNELHECRKKWQSRKDSYNQLSKDFSARGEKIDKLGKTISRLETRLRREKCVEPPYDERLMKLVLEVKKPYFSIQVGPVLYETWISKLPNFTRAVFNVSCSVERGKINIGGCEIRVDLNFALGESDEVKVSH
jgi:hypothetical protein